MIDERNATRVEIVPKPITTNKKMSAKIIETVIKYSNEYF